MSYVIYIVILSLINFVIFIINSIKKDNISYKNIYYHVSTFSLIFIFINIILLFSFQNLVNYYNEYNYSQLIAKQKEIVINYLNFILIFGF